MNLEKSYPCPKCGKPKPHDIAWLCKECRDKDHEMIEQEAKRLGFWP